MTYRSSVSGERKQRGDAGALDRILQLALMQRARSRNAARQNLSALGNELLQRLHVFEIDVFDLFHAELADTLTAIKKLFLSALLRALPTGAALTAGRCPSLLNCHR